MDISSNIFAIEKGLRYHVLKNRIEYALWLREEKRLGYFSKTKDSRLAPSFLSALIVPPTNASGPQM